MFRSACLCVMTALGLGFADAGQDPVAVIRTKDTELQKLLRERDVSQKTDRVKVLVNGIFDFGELGKRALGPTWGKMTAAQRTRFARAFQRWVENASVKKLDAYISDSTRYEAPEVDGDRATVTAHVFSKGSESVVVYKLMLEQGSWKAWDLVIDDLSTAGNYGDQFREILKTKTIDQLIAKLEARANADASAKPADDVKSKSEKSSQSAKASGG